MVPCDWGICALVGVSPRKFLELQFAETREHLRAREPRPLPLDRLRNRPVRTAGSVIFMGLVPKSVRRSDVQSEELLDDLFRT